MKLTRRAAIVIYGSAILTAFIILWIVTVWSEAIDCYTTYWFNPNTAFNSNQANWAECSKHLSWPFSFFL